MRITLPFAALACCLLGAGPAAAAGVVATYAVDAAGLTVMDFEASVDLVEGAYAVVTNSRIRGVASVLASGHLTSRVEGAWRGAEPAPTRYRADGVWRGTDRHTVIDYERGQPVVRTLQPAELDERLPVPPAAQRDTTDVLSALARLVRQVRDTGRCDGTAAIFDGRRRVEFTARSVGTERLDGGRGGWSGEALRCTFENRTVAGFRRDQDPAEAGRPERGTAWIAAPGPGLPPIPVRVDAPSRWFGSINIRLVHAEPLPPR